MGTATGSELALDNGVDPPLTPAEGLRERFANVDFGTLPNLPAIDSTSDRPGNDPVRVSSGNIVTFTPAGTASPGSLYLRGHGNTQYAVRIFGETGKTRVVRYNLRSRSWMPLQ